MNFYQRTNIAEEQDVNYKQARLEPENNATFPRIQATPNCAPESSKIQVNYTNSSKSN